MKHVTNLGGLDYLSADYRKQDFPKHSHDEYLIGLIERGVHDVWCRGQLWHAGMGSIATFAPGEPHFGGAGTNLGWSQKILYLPERLIRHVLDDSGTTALGTLDFKSPFQRNKYAARGLTIFWHLLEDNYSSSLEIDEHLIGFLPQFITQMSKRNVSVQKPVPPKFRSVRDFIHAHSDVPVHLDTLALIAGCSKTALIEGFKKHFGIPPTRYLIQIRIDEARQLLRKGLDIASVATAVGFADQSHLTRHFKAILGVTPARYLNA
jgi:AraC-like DNA-binding protein